MRARVQALKDVMLDYGTGKGLVVVVKRGTVGELLGLRGEHALVKWKGKAWPVQIDRCDMQIVREVM